MRALAPGAGIVRICPYACSAHEITHPLLLWCGCGCRCWCSCRCLQIKIDVEIDLAGTGALIFLAVRACCRRCRVCFAKVVCHRPILNAPLVSSAEINVGPQQNSISLQSYSITSYQHLASLHAATYVSWFGARQISRQPASRLPVMARPRSHLMIC